MAPRFRGGPDAKRPTRTVEGGRIRSVCSRVLELLQSAGWGAAVGRGVPVPWDVPGLESASIACGADLQVLLDGGTKFLGVRECSSGTTSRDRPHRESAGRSALQSCTMAVISPDDPVWRSSHGPLRPRSRSSSVGSISPRAAPTYSRAATAAAGRRRRRGSAGRQWYRRCHGRLVEPQFEQRATPETIWPAAPGRPAATSSSWLPCVVTRGDGCAARHGHGVHQRDQSRRACQQEQH